MSKHAPPPAVEPCRGEGRLAGGSSREKGANRRGLGFSLALHGTVLLCLTLVHPGLPTESEFTSYQVVMVAPEPAPTPATPAPPEQLNEIEQPPPVEAPEQQQAMPRVDTTEPLPAPVTTPAAPEPAPHPYHKPEQEPKPRQAQHRLAPARAPAPPAQVTEHRTPPAAAPMEAARPNPVWLASISLWLSAHRTYPEIARRQGRQGTAVVRFEVDRQGHVLNASLTQGSGSESLDEGALALVRNASLPPFPPDMLSPRETVTVPITYRLEN